MMQKEIKCVRYQNEVLLQQLEQLERMEERLRKEMKHNGIEMKVYQKENNELKDKIAKREPFYDKLKETCKETASWYEKENLELEKERVVKTKVFLLRRMSWSKYTCQNICNAYDKEVYILL